jgi:Flp pilus assembly protein TadD
LKNAFAIVLPALLISACAPLTPPASSEQQSKPAVALKKQRTANPSLLKQVVKSDAGIQDPLPSVPLTEDIMLKILSSEVAAQRGYWQDAYVTLLSLAQQTRDPRLAQRAMEVALGAKHNDEALAAVRVWRDLAPHSEQATQYFLGFTMLSDNLSEAEPIFAQRLRETPESMRPALMFQMQRLLARAKNKAAGFTLLERVLAPYAAMPESHLALAQGAVVVNDNSRAYREALAAQAAKPDSELAALTLAQVAPSKAETEKVLKNFLATYPKSREVRLAYARQLVEAKEYRKAEHEFALMLQNDPHDLTALYALGILAAQTDDNKAAEKYLTEYVTQLSAQQDEERDPTQALLMLSQLAEERKDTEAALKWLNMVEPGEAYLGAQLRRAQLMAKSGDLVGARKLLMEIHGDGEREQVQVAIAEAQILRDAGRSSEGFAALDAALKRYPNNTDLLYDYAMQAEKVNKLDVMEKMLRKVMSLDPKNQQAYNALGYSLADRNLRLPEARDLIAKALELAPNDPFIMDSMGWVNFRMGRLQEAEELLRRAYGLRADAEIAVHLGEVLWTKGQKDEAQKFWRDAQAKDPQNDTLKSTLQRLQVSL